MLHGHGIHLILNWIHMVLNGSPEDIRHLGKVDMKRTSNCRNLIIVLCIVEESDLKIQCNVL